jgi:meiotically up-regulated gene 157 (Mug157) protein
LDSVGWYLHLVRRFLQARIPSSRCRRRQMSGLGLASYKLWDHLDDGLEEGLVAAVELLQRETSPADGSLYTFHRPGGTPLDAVVESDAPYRFGDFDCSLAWSAFRPSDDRSLLPFPIGANALVARELRLLADIILTCVTPDQARCARLVWNRNSPETILRKSNNELPVLGHHLNHLAGRLTRGVVAVAARATRHHGSALPYETDGFGQDLHTDDPNVPGLLSLDWLGTPNITSLDRSHLIKKGLWPWKGNQDPWTSLLPATRSRVLSPDNPQFIPLPHTAVPGGLGSEHTPAGMIWPMSLAVAALGESEPQRRLDWTRALADLCPDGQVHESVDPNEPTRFTRDWFSMGNALGTLALVAASQSREKPTTDRL